MDDIIGTSQPETAEAEYALDEETARIDALLALLQESSFEETALFRDTVPETAESHPFLIFPSSDMLVDEKKLAEIIQDNNTGIEKKLNIVLQNNDDEDEKEYIKSTSYEAKNCYDKNNPYAEKENYKQVKWMDSKEEEEEKSFLWK